MKVYSVQFETIENGRYEFINSLLNKSIFNDYLFEQTFFDISILIDRQLISYTEEFGNVFTLNKDVRQQR